MQRSTSDRAIDRASLFRCLIGDGASFADAERIATAPPNTLAEAFAASAPRERDRSVVGIRVDSAPAAGDLQILLDRLQRLGASPRRAFLAHHVGGIPEHRLIAEVKVQPADLQHARALLELGGVPARETLRPLTELPPPALHDRKVPAGALVLLMAAVGALVAVAAIASEPPRAAPIAAVPDAVASTIPATTTPLRTSSSTTAPSTTLTSFEEPDREVEFLLREDGSIIRVEPWTMRVIWESRPFTAASIVSIDPNTLTIDSNGNRLILSRTDGTLLPP